MLSLTGVSIVGSVKRAGSNWSRSLIKIKTVFNIRFLSPEPPLLLLETAEDEYIQAMCIMEVSTLRWLLLDNQIYYCTMPIAYLLLLTR